MEKEYTSSATLIISGEEMNPDIVTNLINLNPSQSWKKGDVKKFDSGRSFLRPFGGWKLYLPEEKLTSSLNDQLNYWCDLLMDRSESILVIKNLPCQVALNCFISTSNQALMALSSNVARQIGYLGIDLEFDFFCRFDDE